MYVLKHFVNLIDDLITFTESESVPGCKVTFLAQHQSTVFVQRR